MDLEARLTHIRQRAEQLRSYAARSQSRRWWSFKRPPAGPEIRGPNPPLSEEEVVAFERQYGVRLPHEYRQFLIRVANGGMGPRYGLHPLNPGVGDIRKPFPLIKDWLCSLADDDPNWRKQAEYPDELVYDLPAGADPFDGTLELADIGCGYSVLLVVTGQAAGTVWEEYNCGGGPFRKKSEGFLDWYEHP